MCECVSMCLEKERGRQSHSHTHTVTQSHSHTHTHTHTVSLSLFGAIINSHLICNKLNQRVVELFRLVQRKHLGKGALEGVVLHAAVRVLGSCLERRWVNVGVFHFEQGKTKVTFGVEPFFFSFFFFFFFGLLLFISSVSVSLMHTHAHAKRTSLFIAMPTLPKHQARQNKQAPRNSKPKHTHTQKKKRKQFRHTDRKKQATHADKTQNKEGGGQKWKQWRIR